MRRRFLILALALACLPGCGTIALMGWTRTVRPSEWDWGDLRPGSQLRCERELTGALYAVGQKRIYNPWGRPDVEHPAVIPIGEILTVKRLIQSSTGTCTYYGLELRDANKQPVIFSLVCSNREDGSAFSAKELSRIGFRIVKP